MPRFGVCGSARLEAKLDRLLARHYRDAANRDLAKHLRHERPYLFTFLYCPGLVDATNSLAERRERYPSSVPREAPGAPWSQ